MSRIFSIFWYFQSYLKHSASSDLHQSMGRSGAVIREVQKPCKHGSKSVFNRLFITNLLHKIACITTTNQGSKIIDSGFHWRHIWTSTMSYSTNTYCLPSPSNYNNNQKCSFLGPIELLPPCVLPKSLSIVIFAKMHFVTSCGKFGVFWPSTLF